MGRAFVRGAGLVIVSLLVCAPSLPVANAGGAARVRPATSAVRAPQRHRQTPGNRLRTARVRPHRAAQARAIRLPVRRSATSSNGQRAGRSLAAQFRRQSLARGASPGLVSATRGATTAPELEPGRLARRDSNGKPAKKSKRKTTRKRFVSKKKQMKRPKIKSRAKAARKAAKGSKGWAASIADLGPGKTSARAKSEGKDARWRIKKRKKDPFAKKDAKKKRDKKKAKAKRKPRMCLAGIGGDACGRTASSIRPPTGESSGGELLATRP